MEKNPFTRAPVSLHFAKVIEWCEFTAWFIVEPLMFFEKGDPTGIVNCTATNKFNENLSHNQDIPIIKRCACLDVIILKQDGILPQVSVATLQKVFWKGKNYCQQFSYSLAFKVTKLFGAGLTKNYCVQWPFWTFNWIEDIVWTTHLKCHPWNTPICCTAERAFYRIQFVAENGKQHNGRVLSKSDSN